MSIPAPSSAKDAAQRYGKLIVFHPSPNLVGVVDELFQSNAPALEYENVIDNELLNEAIRCGITEDVREKVEQVISSVATEPTPLIFCTCSTLGGTAEEIGRSLHRDVIRIDRPMAEKAVATGRRIGVAAALESTLGPTCDLIEEVASSAGVDVELRIIHCPTAWQFKQAGDDKSYISEVARCIDANAEGLEVIVLAQGSMAPARLLCSTEVPILSSPESGVQRIIELMGVSSVTASRTQE